MATSERVKVPIIYRAFLLLIEPVFALFGAILAHFKPLNYLQLTHGATAPLTASTIPLSTNIVLSQLANLYLLFAFNEAVILRLTSDRRVWRTLLLGCLIADFGHLYSVSALGSDIYWKFTQWNIMDFGNVGFVYAGACLRIAFLCGIGLGVSTEERSKAKAIAGKKI